MVDCGSVLIVGRLLMMLYKWSVCWKGGGVMTARELMEAWEKFPKLGKISFLLKSGYMRAEYPWENEEFIRALDRFIGAEFDGLPWELQDEFGAYVETPIFQIWIKRGGDIGGSDDTNEAWGHVGQKD